MGNTHPKAAAAPRKAYVPGVMQGVSGLQAANQLACGLDLGSILAFHNSDQIISHLYIALTRIPIIRPKVAPIAIEGTKIPHGTRHP